ncbi:unnamed protein product, partial [Heterotrigona itama]
MYVRTKNTDGSSFQRIAKGSSVKRKRSLSDMANNRVLGSTCIITVLRQYSLNYRDTSHRKRVYQCHSIAIKNISSQDFTRTICRNNDEPNGNCISMADQTLATSTSFVENTNAYEAYCSLIVLLGRFS